MDIGKAKILKCNFLNQPAGSYWYLIDIIIDDFTVTIKTFCPRIDKISCIVKFNSFILFQQRK